MLRTKTKKTSWDGPFSVKSTLVRSIDESALFGLPRIPHGTSTTHLFTTL